MEEADLERYCIRALENGLAHAKVIQPSSVVTAPWVRLKCQFGCPLYNKSYSCPPHTPTPEETRAVLDSYQRAILFHILAPHSTERGKQLHGIMEKLRDLEDGMFKDGYHKAFLYLAGQCRLCKDCAKLKGAPCNFGFRARPSMEGCGIDVFQTVRNNGFPIAALKERTETQNDYCLMLVD